MTDSAQILAIAGACGWKESKLGWWSHPTLPDNGGAMPFPPAYLHSLDAMHEAEQVLTPQLKAEYAVMLQRAILPAPIYHRSEDGFYYRQPDFALLHATARQRAEALLRTLNLWVEAA